MKLYNKAMNDAYNTIMESNAPETKDSTFKIKNDEHRNVMSAHAKIMNEDYDEAVAGRISKLMEASEEKTIKEFLAGIKLFAEQNGFLKPDHNKALAKVESDFIKEENSYKKNTLAFINGLLKDDKMDNMKDFLKGLKKQLEATGWLSDKQQAALDKVKKNLEK